MKEIKQIDNRPNTSKKCLFSSSLICNLDVLFSTVQSTDSVRRNSMDSPHPSVCLNDEQPLRDEDAIWIAVTLVVTQRSYSL